MLIKGYFETTSNDASALWKGIKSPIATWRSKLDKSITQLAILRFACDVVMGYGIYRIVKAAPEVKSPGGIAKMALAVVLFIAGRELFLTLRNWSECFGKPLQNEDKRLIKETIAKTPAASRKMADKLTEGTLFQSQYVKYNENWTPAVAKRLGIVEDDEGQGGESERAGAASAGAGAAAGADSGAGLGVRERGERKSAPGDEKSGDASGVGSGAPETPGSGS